MSNTVGPYDAQGFSSSGFSSYRYDRGYFPFALSVDSRSANGTALGDGGLHQEGFQAGAGKRKNLLGLSGHGLGCRAQTQT